MNRSWTDEQLRTAAKESISIAQTLRKLGLVPKGGNYRTIHAVIREIGIDTSHWLGKASGRGKKRMLPRVPLSEVLVENSEYSRACLKKRMLEEGILHNRCYVCGIKPEWNNQLLVLVLDHTNGINNDNRAENIRLLCPNCNSQQKTFCGRKNEGKKMVSHVWKCGDCGQTITREAKWCVDCGRIRSRKVERPSLDSLLKDREMMSMEAIGRKYGVSGNSIKKWIRQAQE
jgi:hypothetical protein